MPTWGYLMFQNGVSGVMEQLIFFHDHMMSIMIMVMFIVGYYLVLSFYELEYSSFIKGGQEMEVFWTLIPAVVLLFIAFPSLRLLYLMEEVDKSELLIKVVGYQWYWNYEYSFSDIESFDSYMLSSNKDMLRLLDVDNELVVPFLVQLKMLISGGDVIHSWTVPSLGVKVDAVPGRLNQLLLMVKRPGTYYGQCSEICGANHSFMPIVMKSVSYLDFMSYL